MSEQPPRQRTSWNTAIERIGEYEAGLAAKDAELSRLQERLAETERERDALAKRVAQQQSELRDFEAAERGWQRTMKKVNVEWARANAAEARLAEVREALEPIEWVPSVDKRISLSCVFCNHLKSHGHEPDCPIGKALAATAPAPAPMTPECTEGHSQGHSQGHSVPASEEAS